MEICLSLWESDGRTVFLAPCNKLIIGNTALAALIPAQLDASSQILRDTSIPTRLPNSAIDGIKLVPALFGHDFREVRGTQGSP